MDKKVYPFKTVPYDHQFVCWDRSKEEEAYGLFMDMGTGKSKVMIDTFSYLYDASKIDCVLILAGKGSYADWVDEHIPIHIPSHIKYKILLWDSTKAGNKGFKHDFDDICRPCDQLRILVMNTEAMSAKKPIDAAYRFVSGAKCIMGIDESTMIKNHKAKRTIACKNIGLQALYRRIMTGRPIVQNPLDVFAQMDFLGQELHGHSTYFSFRARYAIMEDQRISRDRIIKKVTGYQRVDELIEMMKKFSFQIYKEDCLDLPDKVFETIKVELTDEQQSLYDDMLGLAVAEYQGEELTASNALGVLLRIHQITCGIFPVIDGTNKLLENNKMEALLNVIEEMNGKIIIWAGYKDNLQQIAEVLKEKYGSHTVGTYYGATPRDERKVNIQRFQDPDDSMRFFVGSPQTGAYGITLTEAQNVIYYSNSFNLEHRLQSEDRAHRIGQKKTVTYVDIITKKTIDEKIVMALKAKKTLSDMVLDCLGG